MPFTVFPQTQPHFGRCCSFPVKLPKLLPRHFPSGFLVFVSPYKVMKNVFLSNFKTSIHSRCTLESAVNLISRMFIAIDGGKGFFFVFFDKHEVIFQKLEKMEKIF